MIAPTLEAPIPCNTKVSPMRVRPNRLSNPGPKNGTEAEVLFLEVFAGKGVLTAAVRRVGVKTAPPQDLDTGGADFLKPSAVEALKRMG